MCWGLGVTAAMIGAGAVGTAVTLRRGDPPAIPLTLGYFTLMEALQLAGYLVIDQCGTPANEAVTFLSILHIVFQPFVVNAFAMALLPAPPDRRLRLAAYAVCAVSAVTMLMQLHPFAWAGACLPGSTLCGPTLCTVSGEWHIGWDVPYNGLLLPLDRAFGWGSGFPTYVIAVFVMPLLYGAWRFVIFHALAGPILASQLTSNPNEYPAIWCLFSIGILAISLSPAIRRQFQPATSTA